MLTAVGGTAGRLIPDDGRLLAEGTHLRPYEVLGALPMTLDGVAGTRFAVWAPNARFVSVVGDFNDWDHRRHLMRKRLDIGVWEIFVPDIGDGRAYKFRIVGPDGTVQPLKADPYAFAAELRPKTASLTARPAKPDWGDAAHRAHWAAADARREPLVEYVGELDEAGKQHLYEEAIELFGFHGEGRAGALVLLATERRLPQPTRRAGSRLVRRDLCGDRPVRCGHYRRADRLPQGAGGGDCRPPHAGGGNLARQTGLLEAHGLLDRNLVKRVHRHLDVGRLDT